MTKINNFFFNLKCVICIFEIKKIARYQFDEEINLLTFPLPPPNINLTLKHGMMKIMDLSLSRTLFKTGKCTERHDILY